MDNLNDMKTMWMELNEKVSALEAENKNLARKMINEKYKSAKERLINKYNAFIWIEAILIFFMTLFFLYNPQVNHKYRIITLIYWDVFFLIEVIFDCYLLNRIKSVNVYSSSINEVAKKATDNWKLHKKGVIIGMPLAFGAVILVSLALNANEFTIYGIILGGVIGVAIGINQLLKFRKYYMLLQP